MRIPGWNQSKLRRARVLIVGLGALGNEVAKNLTLAGVGNLTLLDFDKVESTNLNRTVLFSAKDVGSQKVEAAARSLTRLNAKVRIGIFNGDLNKFVRKRSNALRKMDLIVGCLDNDEARVILNHVSVRYRIPYVDGGMLNAMGSVRVSIPPYTPCWECGLPKKLYSAIGQRYRCEDLVFEDLTAGQILVRHPTVSTVTSLTAAIQSHETLKILLGLGSFRAKGTWAEGVGKPVENETQYDCRTNTSLVQVFRKDTECYVCGLHSTSVDRVTPVRIRLSKSDSLASLKAKIQSQLGAREFNLVRGLRPFPDRAKLIATVRSLLQRVEFLSGQLSRSTEGIQRMHKSYVLIREFLNSDLVAKAHQSMREGISFYPEVIIEVLKRLTHVLGDLTIEGSQDRTQSTKDLLSSANSALMDFNEDVSVMEGLQGDTSVLCAIRQNSSITRDVQVEVSLD